MAVAFPEIDPYQVLGLSSSATPIEIKKAYKKLSLKFHPDKLQQASTEIDDKDVFPKIQFAYSILSDPGKRSRYDTTGSLGDGIDEDVFDWKQYFDSVNDKITIDMIEEDKLKYQNSEEERQDILNNYIYYEGDFLKLFEVIPHLEFTESEENRVFGIIQQFIDEGKVDKSIIDTTNKYKKSRKVKVKNMLKKLAKEAKEAQELEKLIKDKGKKNLRNENDLKSIIQSRQANRLDDLISNLESKYGKKRGSKRSKDIGDDEFEKIQKNMMAKKQRK